MRRSRFDSDFRGGGRHAFTLTEMLIAIGIIAVLAAVAIPAFRGNETQSLDAVARVLASDLRLARSLAVQYNTDWTVRFEPAANAYELVHTGTGNPPAPQLPLTAPASDGRYRIELNRLGSSVRRQTGTRLIGATLRDAGSAVTEVTFGPTGGTGPLRSEDTLIWISTGTGSDTRYVRLAVLWVTGQIWIDRPATFTSP